MFDRLSAFGAFGAHAPHNQGGRKSRYIATVFAAALLPWLERDPGTVGLLDLGCGTGILAVRARRHCRRAVGLDISMGMLAVARDLAFAEGLALPLVCSDGVRMPFARGSFDRVVACESLCHVPDRLMPAMVAEVERLVRPGGQLYLLDQVSESIRWQQRELEAWGQKKRSVDEVLGYFAGTGWVLQHASVVRQPRFPWIYAIWFGLLPRALVPVLARCEVWWNRRFCPLRTRRWQDALFVFSRRADGA
jgi:SAM-dependent methyltransferase